MKRTDRLTTGYGNWVAHSRFPQFKYVRRLAASNPRDFGVYAFWVVLNNIVNGVRIARLQRQIKALRAENTKLKGGKLDNLLRTMFNDGNLTVKDKL